MLKWQFLQDGPGEVKGPPQSRPRIAIENSRRKVARAQEHLLDLERQLQAFWESDPYEVVIEPHPHESECELHKLKFIKPLPPAIHTASADAISNLRSSLDNACYGVAVAAGRARPHHTAFPISGSSDEFEANLKGRCKDIPEVMYPIFRAFKPYRGGNDALWALNQISIADKHKLGFGIGWQATLANFPYGTSDDLVSLMRAVGIPEKRVQERRRRGRNPITNLEIRAIWREAMRRRGAVQQGSLCTQWNSLKDEIDLGVFVAGQHLDYKADFTFSVTLAEIGSEELDGAPVLSFLNNLCDMVEHVLAGIEAEAYRHGFIADHRIELPNA